MRLAACPSRAPSIRHWNELRDDELLARAHAHGFTTLVTTDKRLATEQPVLPLAVIAVDDNRLPALVAAVDDIAHAVRGVAVGEHRIVAINT